MLTMRPRGHTRRLAPLALAAPAALLALLAALLAALPACSDDPTAPEFTPPRPATEAEKRVAALGNDFGLALLRTVGTGAPADASLCVSPLSVQIALTMALNGAAGETEAAMHATLAYGDLTMAEVNDAFASLLDLLPALDPEVRLAIANSAWIRDDFPVHDPFTAALETSYDAAVRRVPFVPATVDTINDWIADHTDGHIDQLLDAIPPQTALYLVNALALDAPWAVAFDPEATQAADFHRADGVDVPCQLMSRTGRFDHLATDLLEAVDLPYGHGLLSMTVLLPRDGHTVDDVLAALDADTWAAWRAGLATTELTVMLPRFTIETTTLLNDPLTDLGMGVAFGDAADFSRISPIALDISRVLHGTFIEVDEAGTVAAGATIVEFRETMGPAPVRCDRPFVFVIADQHTGAVLFAGVVNDPQG